MRFAIIAAVSSAALLAGAAHAAPAFVQTAAAQAEASISDDELAKFAAAMAIIQPINEAAAGAPSADQQARMAAAVENSGLDVERFNAISAAVAGDAELQARAALAGATPSAPGSVGASVTDEEADAFGAAMAVIQPIAQAAGASPTPEQQAAMAEAVQNSGLSVERFNAISAAVAEDAHLRARVSLADARRGA